MHLYKKQYLQLKNSKVSVELPKQLSLALIMRLGGCATLLWFCWTSAAISLSGGGSIWSRDLLNAFNESSLLGVPVLLFSLLTYWFSWNRLFKATRASVIAVSLVPVFISLLWAFFLQSLQFISVSVFSYSLVVWLISLISFMYLDWYMSKTSPLLSEAKFAALQAKIRPHFFFNAINGIVMLLDKNPKAAQSALLDLSDLFRASLRTADSMVPLQQELELSMKYLSIEKLRFGERLAIDYKVDSDAKKVLVPSLLIQPLVENAVIHGIEKAGSGSINIQIFLAKGFLHIQILNPISTSKNLKNSRPKGTGMALGNIKDRLVSIYDTEAVFDAGMKETNWRVYIKLPI